MGRNRAETRHSKYTIRIVCEGEKTEPLFFTSLCDLYYKGNEDMDVRTVPQPYIPEDEKPDNSPRGNYKQKKRKTKPGNNPIENEVIKGVPPLKWVQYARQILSEGIDESWAVYDKDEHPKHEEALLEANKEIDGKKVNIAFSSRSFEYYLLLHFEYLYQRFNETECGEKVNGQKKIFECGTGKNPEKDCNGKNCINGYARKRGYWQESKSSVSTFPLVKDNLVKGIVNACRLRAESNFNTDQPIYKRNPYTDVDILVSRLIGKTPIAYGETFHYTEGGCDWSMTLNNDGIAITNHNNRRELFPKGKFVAYDWETKTQKELNVNALLLEANETIQFPCKLDATQVVSIQINPDKEILMLPKFP